MWSTEVAKIYDQKGRLLLFFGRPGNEPGNMNMPAKVILNPYSGRWKAKQRRAELEGALCAEGINFELVETSGAGDGVTLAEQAARAVVVEYEPLPVITDPAELEGAATFVVTTKAIDTAAARKA